jgi:hypothetical protein
MARLGNAFVGFREGQLLHNPTFKVRRKVREYSNGGRERGGVNEEGRVRDGWRAGD